jgi:hypothetical protein
MLYLPWNIISLRSTSGFEVPKHWSPETQYTGHAINGLHVNVKAVIMDAHLFLQQSSFIFRNLHSGKDAVPDIHGIDAK